MNNSKAKLLFKKLIETKNQHSSLLLKQNYVNQADNVLKGFMDVVGRTPLIKLERLSKESGCNILVKNESMNPGGNFTLLIK